MTQLTRPFQAASASAAARFARLPPPARGRGAKAALAVVKAEEEGTVRIEATP